MRYFFMSIILVCLLSTNLSPAISDIPDYNDYIQTVLNNNEEMVSYAATCLLVRVEGFSKTVYKDATSHAIGYGFKTKDINRTITKKEAQIKLNKKVKDIQLFLNNKIKCNLTSGQKVALISFIYNIGKTGFIKSKMYEKLNNGEIEEAFNEFDNWVYKRKNCGTLVKSKGLKNRRNIEKEFFLHTGDLIELI